MINILIFPQFLRSSLIPNLMLNNYKIYKKIKGV